MFKLWRTHTSIDKVDLDKAYKKFDKLIPYNANLKTIEEVTGIKGETPVLTSREYLRIFIQWVKNNYVEAS